MRAHRSFNRIWKVNSYRKKADLYRKKAEKIAAAYLKKFTATPFILFALADNGYAEEAYQLLLQDTNPSWLYQVRHGATTMWEQWDITQEDGTHKEGSMNHYSYGAVGDFFYRRICGLEALEPGYRRFHVKPVVGGGLTLAFCSYESPYGLIETGWKQIDREGNGREKIDREENGREKIDREENGRNQIDREENGRNQIDREETACEENGLRDEKIGIAGNENGNGRKTYELTVKVPVGCTCEVVMPGEEKKVVGNGGWKFTWEQNLEVYLAEDGKR